MKALLFAVLLVPAIQSQILAQNGARLNDIKGYRVKHNHTPVIYLNNPSNNSIQLNRTRTLDWTPFFMFVNQPETTVNNTTYRMIIFPGTPWIYGSGSIAWDDASRNMSLVSPMDHGRTYWIDTDDLEHLDTAYHRYRNDIVLGVMTLPFKYRPSRGSRAPSYVDGSFNVGPYVGFKLRLAETRPFFFVPVVSGGVTSITYNSANNTGISDAQKTETGFGFQYCGGIVFDLYKVQMGLILGADHGTGDFAKSYDYQDALWLGLSLNYNFLSNRVDDSDNTN